MLFRVCEHYYENENILEDVNKTECKETCFICYNISVEDEFEPKRLNSQLAYIKFCKCDGFVHNYCLDAWFDNVNECPICRKIMFKNVSVKHVIYNIRYTQEVALLMTLFYYGKRLYFYYKIGVRSFLILMKRGSQAILMIAILASFYNGIMNTINDRNKIQGYAQSSGSVLF